MTNDEIRAMAVGAIQSRPSELQYGLDVPLLREHVENAIRGAIIKAYEEAAEIAEKRGDSISEKGGDENIALNLWSVGTVLRKCASKLSPSDVYIT